MDALLAFTVVGIVTGAIYAIIATGLVVTYTTSGIFNFAHGAIGMFMAFTYWELRVNQGWPAPVALLVALLVLAPAIGVLESADWEKVKTLKAAQDLASRAVRASTQRDVGSGNGLVVYTLPNNGAWTMKVYTFTQTVTEEVAA